MTVCDELKCSASVMVLALVCVLFKQKTAYEMRISDWSSDVCSSDLAEAMGRALGNRHRRHPLGALQCRAAGRDEAGGQRGRAGGNGVALQIGRATCRDRVCQYV